MALSDIVLNLEDFHQVNWQKIIEKTEHKEYGVYSRRFFNAAKAVKADNQVEGSVYEFLGHIASPMLNANSDDNVFSASVILPDGSRSAIPKDFNKEQLILIKELVPTIQDAELKARMADILWEVNRNFQMAQVAVNSYLDSAKRLEDPQQWFLPFERIQRAFCIAVSIGKDNHFLTNVIAYIKELLDKYKAEDPLYFSAKLMKILQKQRLGDCSKYAQLSEKAALSSEQSQQWDRAREYWEVTATWYVIAKDTEHRKLIQENIAESYVKQANIAISSPSPSYILITECLQKAIEAYRRIAGTKERREKLHKLLLEYQPKCVSEMRRFSQEIDTSHIAENVMAQVKGKNFKQAIIQLVLMGCSPSVESLKLQLQELIRDYPLQYLMPQKLYNRSGKLVAQKPSVISNDPDVSETAFQSSMQKEAQFHKIAQVEALIEPARYQINLEHNVSIDDFTFIVLNNPFIPPQREIIYARGFLAGLKGDFLVSTHLLVPQIEHSIRFLLERQGCIVSSLDDRGIQDEHNINVLIHRPELIEILGEDIVFDLKGLLVHRFGNNLRNHMAHGLMNYSEFFSDFNSYLWWLTLRLCCLPIIQFNSDSVV